MLRLSGFELYSRWVPLCLTVQWKSLKSQWIGKITTQQTKTIKVNTVSCILVNILASIYRFESFT